MADQKVSDLPSLNGADVDPADLLYIIDSSAGSAGSKKITVGQYQLAPVSGGTANGVLYLNASKVATAGSDLVFDGSNLGVGTSSPAQRLDVTGAVNSVQARFGNVAGRGLEIGTALVAGTNDAGSVLNAKGATSGTMIFQTDSTERMRLDSSGNLGLGVTPSAWQADWNVYQASRDAAFGGVDGGSVYGFMSVNAYADGSASPSSATWRYKLTGSLASKYEQTSGMHQWFTAPTGTAGNAISFTQAMTLDASGNLLLGTTTASGGRATITAVANYGDLATGYSLVLSNTAGTGSNSNPINVGLIQFGNPTVANADIGRISVVQENPGSSTAGSMRFFTNGGGGNTQTLERARITSGGDLLVGTTDAAATATTNGLVCSGTNPGFVISRRSTGAAQTHFEFRNGGTNVGNITSSTTTTTYATTSDRRLKDNIAPAPSASDVIDAIEIVSHDWKAAPDEHVAYGVIAQDLALVAPQAVLQGDDGDEIEKTWGVDYSKLVPMLIKEIQSLRARVAALESA